MDYLKNAYRRLSGLNFAHLLVLALVVKSIIYDISYASFLLALPVLGFEGYKLYLKHKTPEKIEMDAEIRREFEALKSKVSANVFDKSIKPTPGRW
jgi:hypothetical protein